MDASSLGKAMRDAIILALCIAVAVGITIVLTVAGLVWWLA